MAFADDYHAQDDENGSLYPTWKWTAGILLSILIAICGWTFVNISNNQTSLMQTMAIIQESERTQAKQIEEMIAQQKDLFPILTTLQIKESNLDSEVQLTETRLQDEIGARQMDTNWIQAHVLGDKAIREARQGEKRK